MKEAEILLAIVKGRESDVEELQELLESRLDEVSEREINVSKNENSNKKEKDGIEYQKSITKEGFERLTKDLATFQAEKATQELELAAKRKELTLFEVNLEAKINKFKRDKDALFILEKQLKDERETLDRGFNELRLKQNGNQG